MVYTPAAFVRILSPHLVTVYMDDNSVDLKKTFGLVVFMQAP